MKRLLSIILIAIATNAYSQSALTLDDCRAMAVENNKRIAAASEAHRAATYNVKSARGNFLPDISASGIGMYNSKDGTVNMLGYGVDYEIGTVYTAGITIQQPIYMGGQITAAYRMNKLGEEIAHQQQALTTTEVIVATDEAFAAVSKAQEMVKVAQAYAELLDELLRTVQSAHRGGMKPKNDVLKVQVKADECELSLRRAENALRLATMNLNHCIGLPLDSVITITTQATAVDSSFFILHSSQISGRPEYAMLTSQEALARQEIKLSRAELLPKLGVAASYNYIHGVEIGDRTVLDDGIFMAQLSLSVPLYHFGQRSNKVKAAKAKYAQAQLDREEAIESMTLELTQASNNLDEANLEVTIAERALKQTEENMRTSRSMYDAGMETLADHLEAQALWQQAWATRVEATFNLQIATTAYHKAAGTLLRNEE